MVVVAVAALRWVGGCSYVGRGYNDVAWYEANLEYAAVVVLVDLLEFRT